MISRDIPTPIAMKGYLYSSDNDRIYDVKMNNNDRIYLPTIM